MAVRVVSPSPELHLYVALPGTPFVLVLFSVTLPPGQNAVSLAVKFTVGEKGRQ